MTCSFIHFILLVTNSVPGMVTGPEGGEQCGQASAPMSFLLAGETDSE